MRLLSSLLCRPAVATATLKEQPYPACTGEARTSAFVKRNGGADASFDSFSFDTAASEILLNLVDTYLPQGSPKATALRARAEALRLPSNPLVGLGWWV